MNYVMSDIHGDYEKYRKMLEAVRFSEEDTLYVLGDVIDRGPHGMKLLQDMMLRANVIPILGNHEYMASVALPWLLTEVTEESICNISADMLQGLTEWMNIGGDATIAEFGGLSQGEKEDVLEYLSEFELYDIVEVNGKTFVLVHAGLDAFSVERELCDYDLSELIFHRPEYFRVYFPDKYLVTGHTPTRLLYAEEQGQVLEQLSPEQYRDEIYQKNRHIAIDCGCGYGGRLGCICLDTLECYYI